MEKTEMLTAGKRPPAWKGLLPNLIINPPLLNSANPWATTVDDLRELYNCPYTGAVTIRTSLLEGFAHNSKTHQYTFFDSKRGRATANINTEGQGEVKPDETSSLNTLGYSPIPLSHYLSWLQDAAYGNIPNFTTRPGKPFIISVSGDSKTISDCFDSIVRVAAEGHDRLTLLMEINLSCPNILDKPPPAYDGDALWEYLEALSKAESDYTRVFPLHVGIKTPPYTYQGQFNTLISVLRKSTELPGGCPITFITATNTLGSCLVLSDEENAALKSSNGEGIGGMAGDAIHPLALGNVKTLRKMLDACEEEDVRKIKIIGVGGVSDAAGFGRMKNVGAIAVGVGTALGREGVAVFEKIAKRGEGW